MIIAPTASDRAKFELEKAKAKGRVSPDTKIVMRVQVLQDNGKYQLAVGIDQEDFIIETDHIYILTGLKIVLDKDSDLLLEDSTLFYDQGFYVDRVGPREKEPGEP